LLHHEQKLGNAQTTEFESIVAAGKSARLLSVVSRETETTNSYDRVTELAKGIGIKEYEVHGLLHKLSQHGLIETAASEVAVLGVSQASLLDHAAAIFESESPQPLDRAVIELAELGSHAPIRRADCEERLSDTLSLSAADLDDVFVQSERIGFVDYETDGSGRLYFNGALFRRGAAAKSRLILDSMSSEEMDKLLVADSRLQAEGCLLAVELRHILGNGLWEKLHQIGYFDVSVVVNERGSTEFVSKPDALTKYIPSGLADMLDDAKALASSLTYGIVKSPGERGRINDPARLINVLIDRGFVEG
jgi:DNA-binding MarR family transcriptional regulator